MRSFSRSVALAALAFCTGLGAYAFESCANLVAVFLDVVLYRPPALESVRLDAAARPFTIGRHDDGAGRSRFKAWLSRMLMHGEAIGGGYMSGAVSLAA